MSYLYLRFKPYLRDFVYHLWGAGREDHAIAFPRKSTEHDLLYRLLQKRPADAPEGAPDGWNVKIFVPDYNNKPSDKFNYLSAHAAASLEDSCATMEATMLTSFVRSLVENTMANCVVSAERAADMINWKVQTRAWMDVHGIDLESEDTIYKQVMRALTYYRDIHLIEDNTVKKSRKSPKI